MTPWILFGAGQGAGLALAQQAAGHHPLYALVRKEAQAQRLRDLGVQVTLGDACDIQTLGRYTARLAHTARSSPPWAAAAMTTSPTGQLSIAPSNRGSPGCC